MIRFNTVKQLLTTVLMTTIFAGNLIAKDVYKKEGCVAFFSRTFARLKVYESTSDFKTILAHLNNKFPSMRYRWNVLSTFESLNYVVDTGGNSHVTGWTAEDSGEFRLGFEFVYRTRGYRDNLVLRGGVFRGNDKLELDINSFVSYLEQYFPEHHINLESHSIKGVISTVQGDVADATAEFVIKPLGLGRAFSALRLMSNATPTVVESLYRPLETAN